MELTHKDGTKSLHQTVLEPAAIPILDEEDFPTNQDYLDFIRGKTTATGAGGKLSHFWASILQDRNIGPDEFDQYCLRFVVKAKEHLEIRKVASYFNKGSLRRELTKPTMTFKVLIKGLRVIEVKSFKLIADLRFVTGKTSLHQIEVDLSAESSMDDDKE
jgi:hypothetical protein